MPKRQARRSDPSVATDSDAFPAVERLVAAGLRAVMSFQAWLWTGAQADDAFLSQRFTMMAPHERMTGGALARLVELGLITGAPIQSRFWSPHTPADVSAALHHWRLPEDLGSPLEAEMTAGLALARLRGHPTFASQVCETWRELATAEVLAFLAAELNDHQFDDQWAWNLEPRIAAAVHHLSMAQAFYFCWLAVRDLASAYLRFPGSRDRLPHTLRHAFESKLTRGQSEGWITRPFARHMRCPESAMAAVFSAMITQLRGDYLLLPPTLDNIRF